MILIFAVLILLLSYILLLRKNASDEGIYPFSNKLAKGKDKAIVVLADLHNNTFGKTIVV